MQCQPVRAADEWRCSYPLPGASTPLVIEYRLQNGLLVGNYPDRPGNKWMHEWVHGTALRRHRVMRARSTRPFMLSNFFPAAPPVFVFPEVAIDRKTGRSTWFLHILDQRAFFSSGRCIAN
jgi:hypothetical protein